VTRALVDYFKCTADRVELHVASPLSQDQGYFTWGDDLVCYGRSGAGSRAKQAGGGLYDVGADVSCDGSNALIPFDPDELIENLHLEHYSGYLREESRLSNSVLRQVYYLLRPFLSVPFRKHLQRFYLRGWRDIPFPAWPVDCTADRLQRRLLSLAMKAQGVETLPFIWFWPEGHSSCAIVTHDVEATGGRDLCGALMDVDESFGFHSSFQIVPECRYTVSDALLSSITNRSCEVNVHDLSHDGLLYVSHDEFLRRAELINKYGRNFGASGFRSGALYRNADWYGAYDFLYDMSIPNVAHLDPQRGGCCTVMPYFIGNIVELPVTSIQDYSLFHVVGDYSIDIWKAQIELITANHGLITVLVHPDYVMERRALSVYRQLLGYLAECRDAQSIWTPLPKEVANWWRQRSKMRLEHSNGQWRIEGRGSERARIAYANLSGDDVTYCVEKNCCAAAYR
jgi:hypothetical protein